MSKNFYLFLLLSFQLSFCYEYISDREKSYPPKHRRINKRRLINKLHQNHNAKLFENPNPNADVNIEGDNENLAHIDVASFIEKPEDGALNEENYYKDKRSKLTGHYRKVNPYSRRKASDDDSVIEARASFVNFDEKNGYNGRDFDPNALLADEANQVLSQNVEAKKKLKDTNVENVDKRGLNLFKFPFFSRNKSETLKPKSKKKRKLFDMESRPDNVPDKDTTQKSDDATESAFKVKKRSFIEGICPMCKRIYQMDAEEEADTLRSKRDHDDENKKRKNTIHNSRQYFQQAHTLVKLDDKTTESPETATEEDEEEVDEALDDKPGGIKEKVDETLNSDNHEFSEIEDSDIDRDRRSVEDSDEERHEQVLAAEQQPHEKRIIDADQQRQLAEIDVVERKIDAVKIIKPEFYDTIKKPTQSEKH